MQGSLSAPAWADWWSSPECERYRNRRISGSDQPRYDRIEPSCQKNWLEYVVQKFCQNGRYSGYWASMCCGRGKAEPFLASKQVFLKCDAFDVSAAAIAEAQANCAKQGITNVFYHCVDLNRHVFPPSAYDVVIVQGGAHHIANLEHFYDQLARCMKPGSLLAMHEYVGPSRFRLSPRQIYIAS